MYEFKFLGTGDAFPFDYNQPDMNKQNWQSNVLLTAPSGKRLLIDCGSLIQFAMGDYGFKSVDIDTVYVSHPHGDHCGGLEYFGLTTLFNPAVPKPKLITNEDMVDDIWVEGLSSLQGVHATLNTYFDVHALKKSETFDWEGITFQPVQVIHYMSGFDIVPSYGLLFEVNGKKCFFTSDTQHCPNQITEFYNWADIIWHDCETSPFPSGVHAHYTELVPGLSDAVKAKTWLYHYHPGAKADCVADGFAGWVEKGQAFTL